MLVHICIIDVIFKLFIPTQDQNHPKFKGEKQSYLKFGGFGPSWFINIRPQKMCAPKEKATFLLEMKISEKYATET